MTFRETTSHIVKSNEWWGTASTKSNHQFTVHRYVDDLFLTFDDPNHIDQVFSTFNSIHQKIKFTQENEENNKLAFLDVQITKIQIALKHQYFGKIPT